MTKRDVEEQGAVRPVQGGIGRDGQLPGLAPTWLCAASSGELV